MTQNIIKMHDLYRHIVVVITYVLQLSVNSAISAQQKSYIIYLLSIICLFDDIAVYFEFLNSSLQNEETTYRDINSQSRDV